MKVFHLLAITLHILLREILVFGQGGCGNLFPFRRNRLCQMRKASHPFVIVLFQYTGPFILEKEIVGRKWTFGFAGDLSKRSAFGFFVVVRQMISILRMMPILVYVGNCSLAIQRAARLVGITVTCCRGSIVHS